MAKRLLGFVFVLGTIFVHAADTGIKLNFLETNKDIMPDYPEPGRKYVLNVTILITLTNGGALPTDLGRCGAAIEMAIREARTNILPDVYLHYDIQTRKGMTECPDEENHATYLITNYAYGKAGENDIPPVGLLLGPACSVATQHAGRVAADMSLPLVNSQATSDYFDDQKMFKTLTRLAYTMITLNAFSFKVLDALNYTDVAVIYDEVFPWSQVTGQVFYRAMYYRGGKYRMNPHQLPYKPAGFTQHENKLKEAASQARVILVMAPGATVRKWMLTALDLGMCNGDYLFMTYEWFRSPYFGEYTWRYYDDQDERASKAFRVLLKIASDEKWDEEKFLRWSAEVKSLSKTRFGYTYGPNETVAPAVTGFHDGVILYASALKEVLEKGRNPFNGTLITRHMWNRTIPSSEGVMKVLPNGVKDQSFVLQQSNDLTGGWVTVMAYDAIASMFRSNISPIFWINGKKLPLNQPECGFRNEKLSCLLQGDGSNAMIGAVAAVIILILGCMLAFYIYRKRKFEQELHDDWWCIKFGEVKRRQTPGVKSSGSRMSMKSKVSANEISVASEDHHELSVGRYQGKLLFIRDLNIRIPENRDFLIYLNKIRTIVHDNLNQLVGVCVELQREAVFTEFCIKGSLSDLLHNDSVNLDWSFKFSLITDLITGMECLHGSFLQSHGYLHSSNCVIDGRFVLKITDFHFPMFRRTPFAVFPAPPPTEFDYKPLLWRAPEFLRSAMPRNGTQKGDSYSCGIILQEIICRSDPYYARESSLSYAGIIARVAEREIPPFRPTIPLELNVPRELSHVAESCWKEFPEERPSFLSLRLNLKGSKLMKEGSIMDNLLRRMEKYAQDLETIVAERTSAFFEEKRKAEELLYQVMPRAIADVLKVGGYIPPEAFDCVTVYFSDIVGFVNLSAESTPFEIVDLLNDVYTLFDSTIERFDAYKVETISDTYMVASGLPVRNGNRHAYAIATMSLAFMEETEHFKIRHRPDKRLQLRIGINSGPCAAGVVGLKMPRYCLFGDTVNTASRMESTGQALKIHISDNTKEILDQFDGFKTELRGEIEVKGKGRTITYWLVDLQKQ